MDRMLVVVLEVKLCSYEGNMEDLYEGGEEIEGGRYIYLRTKDYGYRKHEREHENLAEQRSHFGVEAYQCNPRWGWRTLGPPLAPLRGTRPLLPKQERHHPLHNFF